MKDIFYVFVSNQQYYFCVSIAKKKYFHDCKRMQKVTQIDFVFNDKKFVLMFLPALIYLQSIYAIFFKQNFKKDSWEW
jgi:uncharacterized pyridoxamine 5'-phosphate oxidase family protein